MTVWRSKLADDRELWERICRGDARAFDELYQVHARSLEMFLRRLLGSPQAAEDVMQETFTRIWQRPNGFEPGRGTLRAYLFGTGRKRAAEWWRKHGTRNQGIQCQSGKHEAETSSLVADALGRLSEDDRTLIWLREIEGYSYMELAKILEIPIGTVRSRLFNAREDLRKMWQAAPPKEKEKS
jgi:RNA polymerase sigma-70 factor, ECF subfamily